MRPHARNLLAAVVATTMFGASAVAGPLEEGTDAYRERDYTRALELWQPLAERGDGVAQYMIGTLYAEGKGVIQDDTAAFKWFERAANRGNALAQYNVGASYASGAGVKKSDADAAKWFQRAANQGMPFAQFNLGLLYAAGNGVAQDDVEAFKWLELAFTGLPAGGARMDIARALEDVAGKMTFEQKDEAKQRERRWKARPEGN